MGFDMLMGAIRSHMSLLPEVREMALFGRGETGFTSPLRSSDFYLHTRNPSIVQVEFISRYMDNL